MLGRGTATDGPFVVESRISADWDPGYGATARMLGETAMCLVCDRIDSPLEGSLQLCARCSPGGPATYWTRDLEEHVVKTG